MIPSPTLDALARLTVTPQQHSAAFTPAEIAMHLELLPDWKYRSGRIEKIFQFKNYYQTISFVNLIAAVAHSCNHHPDLSVHYSRCEIAFNTHDVAQGRGGISINDFISAARIEITHTITAR